MTDREILNEVKSLVGVIKQLEKAGIPPRQKSEANSYMAAKARLEELVKLI